MDLEFPFLSEPTSIRYVDGDLSALTGVHCRFLCGVLVICTEGRGVVSTGAQQYEMSRQSELIFLDGTLMQLLSASPDFHVRMLLFPKDTLLKAVLPIDTDYLDFLHQVPFFDHKAHKDIPERWAQINLWMDMARLLFSGDPPPRYAAQLEQNYLQSLLMWISNTIPREFLSLAMSYSRKQALYHQFMHLLHEYGAKEHHVAFFADKLCITPRYLNEVVRQYRKGKSPKQLINEQLTAEIKVLLGNPHLSVTEIAQRFNFQEQAHLTRFFKRMTGMSPQAYREQLLVLKAGQEQAAKEA